MAITSVADQRADVGSSFETQDATPGAASIGGYLHVPFTTINLKAGVCGQYDEILSTQSYSNGST
jgi:hypothetical protein